MGGLLLFAVGALLTASYVRLKRRQELATGEAVTPGVSPSCALVLRDWLWSSCRNTSSLGFPPLRRQCSRVTCRRPSVPFPGDRQEVSSSCPPPPDGLQKPARLPPVLVVQPDGVQVCGAVFICALKASPKFIQCTCFVLMHPSGTKVA